MSIGTDAPEQAPAEEPDAVPIVDADVVDDTPPVAASRELVTQQQGHVPQARIIAGEDPEQVLANATKIADALKGLVEAQGFAVNMGGRKPHLEIAAWQAVGVLLGALGGEPLHPETVWSRPIGEKTTYHVHEVRKKWGGPKGQRVVESTSELDYDVEGHDWEARVEIRTAAGVIVGVSEAMCVRAESQWAQKPDPALKSMAETRAASRAFRASLGWVVAIAGYNPTPAEEMPAEAAQPASEGPSYGKAAAEKQVAAARAALGYLFDPENPLADEHNAIGLVLNAIQEAAGGYLPHFALSTIVRVAIAVKGRRDNGDPVEPGAGDPTAETDEEREERERGEALAREHGQES